jgi:hypothetical protein
MDNSSSSSSSGRSNIIPPDNAVYTPDGALQETYNGVSNSDPSSPATATSLLRSNVAGISGRQESSGSRHTGHRAGGGGSNIIRVPANPVVAVGRTQYVQTVRSAIRVYDKNTSTALTNVTSMHDFFQDIHNCTNSTNNNGPSVVYDQFQDRWIIMSTSSGGGSSGSDGSGTPSFYLCMAVSQTLDATGNY